MAEYDLRSANSIVFLAFLGIMFYPALPLPDGSNSLKIQMCSEDRELNQARSKPDPVNRPVRTARTSFFYPVLVFKVLRLSLKPG